MIDNVLLIQVITNIAIGLILMTIVDIYRRYTDKYGIPVIEWIEIYAFIYFLN